MTTTGPAEMTLLQLSDTHLRPAGELMHDRVDTYALLETAVSTVAAAAGPVDALLLTGDLADTGSPAAYRRLRGLVEPLAAALGAETIYAMGNHDERGAFRAELLAEPSGPASVVPTAHASDLTGDLTDHPPCDQVRTLRGLRVVVLDSTAPGRHDGWLTDAQLDWLAAVLAEPAPRGTLLVVHHPPVPSPVPTVNLLRLAAAHRLAAAVAGTDVGMIVCGHAHHAGCGTLGGIPVWVSPALAYDVDPMPPRGRLRGRLGGGFSRIDLVDGQFVATAIPLAPAEAVYDRDAAEMIEFVARHTQQDR